MIESRLREKCEGLPGHIADSRGRFGHIAYHAGGNISPSDEEDEVQRPARNQKDRKVPSKRDLSLKVQPSIETSRAEVQLPQKPYLALHPFHPYKSNPFALFQKEPDHSRRLLRNNELEVIPGKNSLHKPVREQFRLKSEQSLASLDEDLRSPFRPAFPGEDQKEGEEDSRQTEYEK